MRILFITFGLPYPPDSGVRIHDFYLIKNVSQHHSVLLLSLITSPQQDEYIEQIGKYCDFVDFVVAKTRSVREQIFGIVQSLCSSRPLATHTFIYDEMLIKIKEAVNKWNVDVVQIEHSFLAPYVEAISTNNRCKKILSFHNLGAIQYKRMMGLRTGFTQKSLFLIKWILMLQWEAKYAEKFDHCLVVSPIEGKMLKSANPRLLISVIENGVDTELYRPIEYVSKNNDLLFIGVMGYPPNVDGILYFCEDIMPIIQCGIPDIRLVVVGHEPVPEIRKLVERGNVIVTGYVEDVVPYYQQSKVTIVPLRGGGGTRLKILESMALGRPVVSTSIGCEGLNVADRENIMIADTPMDFVQCVIQLLTDKKLRERIAHNARCLVETHYDWSKISQRLMEVYDNIVDHPKL